MKDANGNTLELKQEVCYTSREDSSVYSGIIIKLSEHWVTIASKKRGLDWKKPENIIVIKK